MAELIALEFVAREHEDVLNARVESVTYEWIFYVKGFYRLVGLHCLPGCFYVERCAIERQGSAPKNCGTDDECILTWSESIHRDSRQT